MCSRGADYRCFQACNKAQTTWNPEVKDESQLLEYACDTVNPLHTTDTIPNDNPTNVKGESQRYMYEHIIADSDALV